VTHRMRRLPAFDIIDELSGKERGEVVCPANDCATSEITDVSLFM